jgi:hypothetical protein
VRVKAQQDQEFIAEIKRKQLFNRDQSKSSLLTTLEEERRHLQTLKREDREQRLVSARSRVELTQALSRQRVQEIHRNQQEKTLKIREEIAEQRRLQSETRIYKY